jgi:hypothetical protein
MAAGLISQGIGFYCYKQYRKAHLGWNPYIRIKKLLFLGTLRLTYN